MPMTADDEMAVKQNTSRRYVLRALAMNDTNIATNILWKKNRSQNFLKN